jgi:hypothetical protein
VKEVESSEGDGFIVYNKWLFEEPDASLGGPAGYDWLSAENLWVNLGGGEKFLAGQGDSSAMKSWFGTHSLVELNGRVFDPSYGKDFDDLPAWEEAAIEAITEDATPGYFYARKRTFGETVMQFK